MGGLPALAADHALAEACEAPKPAIRFVMVWVGDRYGVEYPTILADMLVRNASNLDAFTVECVTDRPAELPEGIRAIPAPEWLPGWWAKCALFSPTMPWDRGDRIVYFDLDVAITGRLEDLVEHPGIIRDFHWPCYNSSVMVWDHGDHRVIWDKLTPARITREASPILRDLLPAGQINGGDQEHLTEVSTWETFPRDWFASYRDCHAWPPSGCKAVILHGSPKPHEITTGWVPNVWKIGGFTSLPEFKGVNTTVDQRMENVRSAVLRDLPWFTGFGDEGKTCVVVAGAPSMRDCLADIKAQKRRGSRIVSVNNAWRFLVENGIVPDAHVMLDARPENAEFLKGAPKSTRYVLASQCHPAVFDALEGYPEVVIWHNGFNENTEMLDVLKPWWDEGPNQKPCILVPGGSTVGLRALWLAHFSGFRTIHAYGIDSSYAADGSHHAYAQSLNDGETVIEAALGEKRYVCAPWMCRQAAEFQQSWFDLKAEGTRIFVHGSGLIPDMARQLREEERAA